MNYGDYKTTITVKDHKTGEKKRQLKIWSEDLIVSILKAVGCSLISEGNDDIFIEIVVNEGS